jgi:hypothetical protein
VSHLQLLIDRLEQDDVPAAFLLLDWEKAFDRVSHKAILKLFEALKLPADFTRSLKAIYRHSTAKVSHANFLSSEFPILSGTKQGDPLSPLIFVLVAELFNTQISQNIKGVGGTDDIAPLKILAYANDTVVGISSSKDLIAFFDAVETFERATAAKLNYSKSFFFF